MTTTDRLFGLADALPLQGRHAGFVKLPFSSDLSAYGFIPLPIAIIGGGEGPTVLLLAGVFGDEQDSQVAAVRIAQMLDPGRMNGRVIVLPAANLPAARAGTRNSPIDGRNLARSFPGDMFGTPTSIIADYIERQLMPLSDIVLDLHSDGRSIRYVPSVTLIQHSDPDIRARRLAVALAFGASNLLLFDSFEDRNTSGAARRAGAVRIATEIGGPDPATTTAAGIMRVLNWAGVTDAPVAAPPATERYLVRQDSDFAYSLFSGVFEPTCRLGQSVAAGDLVGRIHDVMRPLDPPVPVHIAGSGTVVCMRGAGLTEIGDCLAHLGAPVGADMGDEFAAAAQLLWLPTQRPPGSRRRQRKQK